MNELFRKALLIQGEFRPIPVAAANAIFLVDQFRWQGRNRAKFGIEREIKFQRPALLAPPANFEIGGDEFVQDREAQRIAAWREELAEVDILGLVPRLFKPVGQF